MTTATILNILHAFNRTLLTIYGCACVFTFGMFVALQWLALTTDDPGDAAWDSLGSWIFFVAWVIVVMIGGAVVEGILEWEIENNINAIQGESK